jgi:hypothetical protein
VSFSISTSDVARQLGIIAATAVLALGCTVMAGVGYFDHVIAGQSRVPNVRLVPDEYRAPLLQAYIEDRIRPGGRPLIAVLGDSQSWGFRHREARVFTAILQQQLPAYDVVNLSIVDGRLSDQMMILKMLKAQGIRPRLVITSANITHIKTPDLVRLVPSARPYWSYFLSPINVYRVGQFAIPKDPEARDMAYRRFQVPDRFLDSAAGLDGFLRTVEGVLRMARSVGDEVLFYAPPYAVEDFASYKYDRALYDRQVKALMEACHTSGVQCEDLSVALPLSAFQDVVHLNRGGQMLLADKVLAKILQIIGRSAERKPDTKRG